MIISFLITECPLLVKTKKYILWYFVIISPLEKEVVLYLKKNESPSPKDALCRNWLKLVQWFLTMYFRCFVTISPGKRAWPLIWTILNKFEYSSFKNALCQVWLKLVQWFLRSFLYFVNVFSLFKFYLPFEKGMALYLKKKLNPLNPRMLCAKF